MIEGMSPGRRPGHPRARTTLLIATSLVGCTAANPAYLRSARDADDPAADDHSGGMLVVDAARPRADAAADLAGPDLVATGADAEGSPDLAGIIADRFPDAPSGPRRLVLADGSSTGTHGGSGGAGHTELCPGDQVIIGYHGSLGLDNGGSQVVYSLSASCGELVVVGANPYTVTVTARGTLTERGGTGSTRFTALCPANHVVVGFSGRAGSFLDQLQLQCAALSITSTAPLSVVIGTRSFLGRSGGSGGSAFQDACLPGQVVRGHTINEGALIDALGFFCGVPTLVE
jgi:hypothetical protein